MRLPHSLLLALLLRRGVVLWLGARVIATALLFMALALGPRSVAQGPLTSHLGPVATPWFLVMIMLVMWLDLRRRHELMLVSNLGLAPAFAAMLGSLPAIAGEIAIVSFLP